MNSFVTGIENHSAVGFREVFRVSFRYNEGQILSELLIPYLFDIGFRLKDQLDGHEKISTQRPQKRGESL